MTGWEEHWPEEDQKEAVKIWAEIDAIKKNSKWVIAGLIVGICVLAAVPFLGIALLAGAYFGHNHLEGKKQLLLRIYKKLLDKNRGDLKNDQSAERGQ